MMISSEVLKGVFQIPSSEARDLKKKILKPPQASNSHYFSYEEDPTCWSLAYKLQDHIVTVASFYIESHMLLSAGAPYRLRGMATDTNYQGQGYGEKVLLKAFEILETKRCDLLWCNARMRAVPFYSKLGFQTIGDVFEIEGIGPHKVMYKRFNPR